MRQWKPWSGGILQLSYNTPYDPGMWFQNASQLKSAVELKQITNLEYLEGIELLKEIKSK